MKMKILITGAAGFIGFHVAQRLLEEGHFVIGLDNFNDYYDPSLKIARKNRLSTEIILGDVTDQPLIFSLLTKHEITHVLHLAAQAGVRYSLKNPKLYMQTNLDGFLSVLEAIRVYRPIPLVYASSSSVYGTNQKIPFSEEDPTNTPSNLYGATKKANELMAFSYYHLFQIPSYGLRYFTVYGPWGRPDMAYFSFAKAIQKNLPIQIFNHGNMRRDFTYIDDIVDGTIAALIHCKNYDIFNLGNHQPVSLLRFLKILEEALGKKAQKEFLPMQLGDMEETYAEISKSQKVLGFFPKTSLETGLMQFAEWFQSFC